MSDKTKIEWADATINAINGCHPISPGCTNCYAMAAGARNLPGHPSTGLTKATKAGHVWTGEVRLNEKALLMPLSWKRPRRIFWNAHDEWIDRMFAVMALTPHHIHMVLTKRPKQMREYFAAPMLFTNLYGAIAIIARDHGFWDDPQKKVAAFSATSGLAEMMPLPNVWLGVSVEDQARKDRIDDLRNTPAAVRFISAEPLLESLGEVDLTGINWVIVGGESGPKARPMHPDWARSLRDQCAAAGVAFHFKQWGEWAHSPDAHLASTHWMSPLGKLIPLQDATNVCGAPMVRAGKKVAGRKLDGVEHSEFPA